MFLFLFLKIHRLGFIVEDFLDPIHDIIGQLRDDVQGLQAISMRLE
jgi:hypothetical protein